ncbi:hypothetical protein EJB05_13202, partial [Eragrostis curvula]
MMNRVLESLAVPEVIEPRQAEDGGFCDSGVTLQSCCFVIQPWPLFASQAAINTHCIFFILQVSQVPKGRGQMPEMADKDEDSFEEGRGYPSLCNWYKDEDTIEEGRAYPSLRNWYTDGASDEKVGCLLHALIGTRINSL